MKVIGLDDHMRKQYGLPLVTMDTVILSDTGKVLVVGTSMNTVGTRNTTEIIRRAMATERSIRMNSDHLTRPAGPWVNPWQLPVAQFSVANLWMVVPIS